MKCVRFAVVALLLAVPQAFAAKTGYVDALTLTIVGNGQTYLDVLVQAGSVTGAPAGFSLQWMKESDFNNPDFGGPRDQWGWPIDDTKFCKASFSGNAYVSPYNLLANNGINNPALTRVVIRVGDIIADQGGNNGFSTMNCGSAPLACDTRYVFRAFAHAVQSNGVSLYRSPYSFASGTTDLCDVACNRKGFGYWKNNPDEWQNTSLTLGSNTYSWQQLVAILNTNPAQFPCGAKKNPTANGLIQLAHQLIAAKLNGFCFTSSADGTIGSLHVPYNWTDVNGVVGPAGTIYVSTGDCLAPSAVAGQVGRLHSLNDNCESSSCN